MTAASGSRWPAGVVFDLDGTLIDSAPSIAEAINIVLARRRAPPVSDALVRTLVSRGAAELIKTSFGPHLRDPAQDLAEFRAVYGSVKPSRSHLYPGALEMLHALCADGVRLGICTNKPQSLSEGIIAALELTQCFVAVVGGDTCSRPKPHPDHIYDTLAQMGVSADLAVYVGDSEVDANAAAAARLPFVLVTFGYALDTLDEMVHQARIDHFDEMPGALRKLAAMRG